MNYAEAGLEERVSEEIFFGVKTNPANAFHTKRRTYVKQQSPPRHF